MTINLDARDGLKYYGELYSFQEITEGGTELEAELGHGVPAGVGCHL